MSAGSLLRRMSYEACSRAVLSGYQPPEWARELAQVPEHRLKLAQLPTPIHHWNLPGVPEGFQVSIKRDDMSGVALSGNKVRKLEFLLADALHTGCDSTVTLGSIQSNHCRATAVASRELGLKPHVMLRCRDTNEFGCQGNLLLDRLAGATIIGVPYRSSDDQLVDGKVVKGLLSLMEDYGKKLREKGCKPYCIPIGGSNALGSWGYIEAFREMLEQDVPSRFDDVFMAVGSGGTATGLAVANYLTGSKMKIHAVCVSDDSNFFYGHVDQQLESLGLTRTSTGQKLRATDIVDIIDGYKGKGYSHTTDEELRQLADISSTTGILLDLSYTLKAVRGMLGEMKDNSNRLKGKRVLFVHTGGFFSNFDGRLDATLKSMPATSEVHSYKDVLPDVD